MNKDNVLNEKVEDYLNYLKYERKLSHNTYESYAYNLKKISSSFEDKSLTNLTEDEIRQFLYDSKESAKTNAHYLTVLKSFYDYLLDNNEIKVNPCLNIKMPKIEKSLPKFLTIDEVNELLNINLQKPIDYRDKAMLEVLYATGIRISELLDLNLSSYNEKGAFIKVMGKGSKERIIPLSDITINYLNLYIKEYRPLILKDKESPRS